MFLPFSWDYACSIHVWNGSHLVHNDLCPYNCLEQEVKFMSRKKKNENTSLNDGIQAQDKLINKLKGSFQHT